MLIIIVLVSAIIVVIGVACLYARKSNAVSFEFKAAICKLVSLSINIKSPK